jgi:hypothetical protein
MRFVESKISELTSKVHDVLADEVFAQLRDQDRRIGSEGSGDIQINATFNSSAARSVVLRQTK